MENWEMKGLIILTALIFFIGCASKPGTSSATPYPTLNLPTPIPTTQEDLKREYRRKAIEQSQADMKLGGGTATLEGANEDVLKVTSSRLSDFEILQMLKESFEAFHNLGIKKLIIIDKDNKRREVDLTVMNKKGN
jgi:hypothetical protein